MDVLVERWAGLDVHRDTVVATVRRPASSPGRGQREQQTRTFATTTTGITALGDWLLKERVTRAGMESTGVYWKPVCYLLEVWLINAEHLRNVPGRKTDVADSSWIAPAGPGIAPKEHLPEHASHPRLHRCGPASAG